MSTERIVLVDFPTLAWSGFGTGGSPACPL
jgi:hypothetical protein